MYREKPVDYSRLRLHNLFSPEYRHLPLLFFWPIFGLAFAWIERLNHPQKHYFIMHCALDDRIPFCEFFAIPYYFWYIFIVGFILYSLLYYPDAFRRYMKFVILTYGFSLLLYILFPNGQNMRPTAFLRDNLLVRAAQRMYRVDTNTNVCPSIHVIGSVAVLFGSWQIPRLRRRGWRLAFWTATILISLSTVFMKQHSVLDVAAALPVCLLAYPLCFGRRHRHRANV